jgi:hypothetical protein
MSRKFKVWMNSGANIHSCYSQEIELSQLGIADADWDLMTDDEKEECMKDVAWERVDWGFREIFK